jgi:hypothetical protein
MRYFNRNSVARCLRLASGLILMAQFYCTLIQAQTADGNNGINQANTIVRSYYESSVNLVYAIGAIVALIGAVVVYYKMNHGGGGGGGNVGGAIALWFGGAIFLVVVTTVIKAFFGL